MADEQFDEEVYTLTDEDGNEKKFELIGSCELDGQEYFALVPLEDNENNEYVILKSGVDEEGDEVLSTIDDDEEFNKVAEIFEEELFNEVDYDAETK